MNDATSNSADTLETTQKTNQPVCVHAALEEETQTEGGIEEGKEGGINWSEEEEGLEQVGLNALTAMEEEGQKTEEERTGDNVIREKTEVENEEEEQEEEDEAKGSPPQATPHHSEELQSDKLQDDGWELEKGDAVKLALLGDEVTPEETTSQGESPEEPPGRADEGEKLREELMEKMEGGGGEGEELEWREHIAKAPVTILDDEFEELEESRSTEVEVPQPSAASRSSEDAIPETKDGENQEVGEGMSEAGTEREHEQSDEKKEEEMELNRKVKGLNMENGDRCPELQPIRTEGCGTARVMSSGGKDHDWIKKDQSEEEATAEMKDWRKDLRPVKKDSWESDRGREEGVKKEERKLLGQEAWIQELKSVIRNESRPKKRDEQAKKKRVVLLEDGRSYVPQREETREERREEVRLLSHRRVGSTMPKDYEISLYVKVTDDKHISFTH